MNCRIPLGESRSIGRKSTQMLCLVNQVYKVVEFMWINDFKPSGVSLYICDGMWSTSPY